MRSCEQSFALNMSGWTAAVCLQLMLSSDEAAFGGFENLSKRHDTDFASTAGDYDGRPNSIQVSNSRFCLAFFSALLFTAAKLLLWLQHYVITHTIMSTAAPWHCMSSLHDLCDDNHMSDATK